MKEKLITFTLIITTVLASIIIVPYSIGMPNFPRAVVLLIGGAFLLILTFTNYKKLYIQKQDVLMIIYALLVIVSTMFSQNIKKSIIGQEDRYEGTLMIFTYILIYLTSSKFFKKETFKNYSKLMYIIVFLIGVLSIIQYYFFKVNIKKLDPLFKAYNYGGSSGTFGNSNFLGSFVSIFLPITMAVYIIKGKPQNLILMNILFSSMLICIARSSWVAFLVYSFILVIYVIIKRKKAYFIRALVTIISFVCVFTILTSTGKQNIVKKRNVMVNEIKQVATSGVTEKTGSGRIAIWKMVGKLILRNFWQGVGPDCLYDGLWNDLDIRYHELVNYVQRTGVYIDKAHNEYLQIAVTTGVPSLLVYLVFLSLICLKNLKLILKNKAIFIIWLAIISYLVQAFFNISTIGIAPLFWLMLGFISNKELLDEIDSKLLKG